MFKLVGVEEQEKFERVVECGRVRELKKAYLEVLL